MYNSKGRPISCRVLQGEEGELTLHVHVRRLVHEVHEELGGVDEDLVSAVADGAVPPGALRQVGRKQKTEVRRAFQAGSVWHCWENQEDLQQRQEG